MAEGDLSVGFASPRYRAAPGQASIVIANGHAVLVAGVPPTGGGDGTLSAPVDLLPPRGRPGAIDRSGAAAYRTSPTAGRIER